MQKTATKTVDDVDVATIVKQMATVLKNMRTYRQNHPVLHKSLEVLYGNMTSFLQRHESLTLLVKEHDLVYGSNVVYTSDDKMESLAFSLFKDGVRLLSFRDGIPPREMHRFMSALNDARDADPYQADLVTILWEKDLAYISYRAVDAYLEDEEKKKIEAMVQKSTEEHEETAPEGEQVPGDDFFAKELGFSLEQKTVRSRRRQNRFREAEARRIVREILDEEDQSILRRCSEICLEILNLKPREDTFNRVVSFLGRISDWLASSGDYLSACTIVSDLRSIAVRNDLAESSRSSIMDTIETLGEARKIRHLGEKLEQLSEPQAEEIFAYLVLMSPVAVEPLCEILAECEVRKIRYLLCRAISVIAKNEPMRLRHFMQDKRWFFVRNLVMILGMTSNPGGIPLLATAVGHSEDRVRREVARSLGRIRDPHGVELLKSLVTDDNKMVRTAALSAMRDIGAADGREVIEPLITDKAFNKKSPDEQREIMRTYGSLGEDGFELLEAVLDGSIKHLGEKARASAVYGIAMIQTGEAMRLLADLAGHGEGHIRSAAAEAFATI
ncbi:MAG: HEAT repeat domain-containing protein [Candidatus Eisenbacteria bacterium]